MQNVRLDAISFDAGTQVRAAINEQVVADYAKHMAEGVVFPPVVLFHDGNQYYMADGFHRAMAAKRTGLMEIPATVAVGTKTDALWSALGALRDAGQIGLRSNESDKRHAVLMAIETWPEKSSALIAEQLGCSKTYVSSIKSVSSTTLHLPDRVVGKDGRSYPASPQISRTAREEATERLKSGEAPDAVQSATGIGRDMLNEIRRSLGLSMDKSREGVQRRRDELKRLADDGYTTRQIAASMGLSERGCAGIAKSSGIDIHADRAVGKTKRHDSNRIITQIVADAENLTEGVNLIDFADIDRSELAGWLRSLQESRDKLGAFIRRLMKEQQHGEAA